MNKGELIDTVAGMCDLTKAKASQVVDALFDPWDGIIPNELERVGGEPVALHGFGSIRTVQRAERQGTKPGTGEPLIIPAGPSIRFRAGKVLQKRVSRADRVSG
jgi:DNA-binding protein HU-beta